METTISFDDKTQEAIRKAVIDLISSIKKDTENDIPEFLNITDTAKYLNVGYWTVKDWTNKYGLPVHRVGNREIYKRSEVDEWLVNQ